MAGNRGPEGEDQKWMELALRWAEKGRDKTRPNPLVGAVIVKDGKLLSAGYHRRAGEPHAEIDALKKLQFDAKGATLYVNLEPCCHYGRTGPCTQAIIRSGIKRVVAAIPDPDPRVNGEGFRELREAGIQVTVGPLSEEAARLNAPYLISTSKKRPYVHLKLAVSLDAKIATATGESKWLSGEEARRWVHRLRSKVDAVMVGKNTVLRDDPQLTVRMVEGTDPLRVVLDSELSTPLEVKLFNPPLAEGTAVFTTESAPREKAEILKSRGVTVHTVPAEPDGGEKIHLESALAKLHSLKVQQLLVEGGAELSTSLLAKGLVDELHLFYTPRIIGKSGLSPFQLDLPPDLASTPTARELKTQKLGKDVLITAVFSDPLEYREK